MAPDGITEFSTTVIAEFRANQGRVGGPSTPPGSGSGPACTDRRSPRGRASSRRRYEHWVGSEGLSFRGRDDAERLGDVVKFHWDAVAKDDEVFAVGLNFLVLATNGRIERDYTFIVA